MYEFYLARQENNILMKLPVIDWMNILILIRKRKLLYS